MSAKFSILDKKPKNDHAFFKMTTPFFIGSAYDIAVSSKP